ncbi:hypothetical protein BKA62DRAFT_678848 [Auriculariales sp. MPI-PUGE-AT-0066]|nr:hypothetical protein BKA62DRAFT_678848 [Auriculariales sp. MPI-PUGE-AT-0066]
MGRGRGRGLTARKGRRKPGTVNTEPADALEALQRAAAVVQLVPMSENRSFEHAADSVQAELAAEDASKTTPTNPLVGKSAAITLADNTDGDDLSLGAGNEEIQDRTAILMRQTRPSRKAGIDANIGLKRLASVLDEDETAASATTTPKPKKPKQLQRGSKQTEGTINMNTTTYEQVKTTALTKHVTFFESESPPEVPGADADNVSEEEEVAHNFSFHDQSVDFEDGSVFLPQAASTPFQVRAQNPPFDDAEYEEDPSILEVLVQQKATQQSKGTRKVSKAELTRRAAGTQNQGDHGPDRFFVRVWDFPTGKSASKVLRSIVDPILKSSFHDRTTLLTQLRNVYGCKLGPEEQPPVQYKMHLHGQPAPLETDADFKFFLQEVKRWEQKPDAAGEPIHIVLVSDLLQKKVIEAARTSKTQSKVPSILLAGASGTTAQYVAELYNEHYRSCGECGNVLCLVGANGTHLKLSSNQLLAWAAALDKPLTNDPAYPPVTITHPPMIKAFAQYHGEAKAHLLLDRDHDGPSSSGSTTKSSSSKATAAASTPSVELQVISAIGKMFSTALSGTAALAAPQPRSRAARGVKYTTVYDLLQKLTAAEADDGGRDFTVFADKFRDHDFHSISELRKYSADDFIRLTGMRLGPAEAFAQAVANEIELNEAAV